MGLSHNALIYAIAVMSVVLVYLVVDFIGDIKRERKSTAEDRQMTAEAQRIADETGYSEVRDEFMLNVFGASQYKQRIDVSATIASNFSGYKYLDYLTKYFNMKLNNETLDYVKSLREATEKLENAMTEADIPDRYMKALVPAFTALYTSAGKRSRSASTILFDCSKLQDIEVKLEALAQKSNHAKRQRSKMTPALKKTILERDNYTCQNCGNSIYKEPNLLLEIDHIIPVSKGGETEPDNLQTLCWRCNRSKSDSMS